MRKLFLILAGILACAFSLMAQPPMGGGGFPGGGGFGGGRPPMGGGGGMPGMGAFAEPADTRTPEERTADLVEKYGLDAEQEASVLALNKHYFGGNIAMAMEVDSTATMDFRQMQQLSDEEREEMMASMQERMSEMMEKQQEIANNQENYENALKTILTKKQYRKYRTDKEKEQLRRQREMERAFQSMMGGGFPGGGFGGPGGGFGGPGGF